MGEQVSGHPRIRRQARVRVGIRGVAWLVSSVGLAGWLGSDRERAGLPELLDSTGRCEMGRTVGTCSILFCMGGGTQRTRRQSAIRNGVSAGVWPVGDGDGRRWAAAGPAAESNGMRLPHALSQPFWSSLSAFSRFRSMMLCALINATKDSPI